MKTHRDVNINKGIRVAMYLLLADMLVTVGEAIIAPYLLIEKVILLHAVIACVASFAIVKCLGGVCSHYALQRAEIFFRSLRQKGATEIEEAVHETLSPKEIFENEIKLT